MNSELKAILERLATFAIPVQIAASAAKLNVPDGEILLAIVSKRADGTGTVGATFEAEEFLKDLRRLDELVDQLGDH